MLKLHKVHKKFKTNSDELHVLKDVSMHVTEGEFVAIVGASGCGKSTLLRMVVGLEEVSDGEIHMQDAKISGPHVDRGMVFQHFALFPWLSVSQNISFGLNVNNKFTQKKIEEIVNYYLDITGLLDHKDSYPHTLSGGMQQRVALARTLANNPKLICMDEPFGALDVLTRTKMQEFLLDLWEKDKKTVLFVTHDIEEALLLADRILIFEKGTGIKQEITVPFGRPRSSDLRYTHEFVELKKEIASLIS